MPPVKKKISNRPPIPFTPVEQLPAVLAVLAWGRSGTGKTTFASTFPKPLLLLDIREKGTDSVSNVKGVKVGEITEWDQVEEVYWYLKAGNHDFKTIVIDQLTAMQGLALAKAMKEHKKESDEQVSKRDFGQAAGLMNTWLLNYRDLIDDGIHVVFLAHDRLSRGGEDADSGEDQIDPEVGPRVMPSVASILNGAVKIIGNTFIRETYTIENKRKHRHIEYSMRIGPHAYFVTKVRSPVGIASPESIVNPTFDKLLAIMRGDYSDQVSRVKRKR